ncbi:MAG: glycosyltransferase family 2 protein [Actinobacteria bacterium]|nr:glycosyltransferase family 2 protein [Actinomycetota bacterium]
MTEASNTAPRVSVVIATYERPDALERCLEHLRAQLEPVWETIVVDASPTSSTKDVCDRFPEVRYIRNDAGIGTLPLSRKIGAEASSGDIIAFIDDDAFADPGWSRNLVEAYGPGIGGVVGQARNDVAGETSRGADEVGRLYPDGRMTANFAADTGGVVDVDHMIGCNMSVSREALDQIGGVPQWPSGIEALGEDLLLSLRLRQWGWRLVFAPRAGVLHIGAPQHTGRRFGVRYQARGARNRVLVLCAVYGPGSSYVRGMVVHTLAESGGSAVHQIGGAVLRFGASAAGLARGLYVGIRYRRTAGCK